MPKLQVALDIIDLDKALNIAMDVADYVDHVEVGTPLIKYAGMNAVKTLSENLDRPIVADLKTVDTGYLEAEMAFTHGAKYVTVLAASHRRTIEDACRAAEQYGGGVMVDTIGVLEIKNVINKVEGLRISYILIHSGIDMQVEGLSVDSILRRLDEKTLYKYDIGVAGGITYNNIDRIVRHRWIKLVIVGGGITKAKNPRMEAMKLYNYLLSMT